MCFYTVSSACLYVCVCLPGGDNHVGECVICFFQGQVNSHQIRAATILVSSALQVAKQHLLNHRKQKIRGSDCWCLSLHVRHKPKGADSSVSQAGIWQQWDAFQPFCTICGLAVANCVGSNGIRVVWGEWCSAEVEASSEMGISDDSHLRWNMMGISDDGRKINYKSEIIKTLEKRKKW